MADVNNFEDSRRTLVQTLARARASGRQVTDVERIFEINDENAAFEIMVDVAEVLAWRQSGWKIAATSALLQERLRTAGPVCGITFTQFHTLQPATLARSALLDPVIECEFFFVIGQDLPSKTAPYTVNEVASAVREVRIGIEVAECRFPHKQLPAPLYVYADGFASGRYIHGASVPDWNRRLQHGIDVTLMRNGHSHGQGSSRDVMDNPLHAVTWLSNWLGARSMRLRRDDIVSSGSCNILAAARTGDKFLARFADIGEVAVEIR